MDMMRIPLLGLLLSGYLALPGCAGGGGGLGTIGDILGGVGLPGTGTPEQGQLSAEVQSVDTRQQQIHLRTQEGQSGTVFYDQSTVVVYRQEQYPVTALERGDLVLVQVQQDSRNNLYASRIDVQQSVQERTGTTSPGGGGLQQFAGRVGQIDYERGYFELQTDYSGTLTVSLPYNPPSATVDQFRRLRRGDTVRIEATPVSNDRVELYRFI